MRKTFVWALVAMMAVAGSALAQTGEESNPLFGAGPAVLDNDSSCDISVSPAATLLLPYFEVDVNSAPGVGDTTLFTITNVSALPQIAHVTIWTDLSAPVLDFNIFLTGYDVQAINLYDIIVRGRIAEPGTSSATPRGIRSAANTANTNITSLVNCDRLAVNVPAGLRADMVEALTDGVIACGRVGTTHADGMARGYVTVDLASNCNVALPTDPGYATTQLLFDNVLIGDYQQVDPANDFAQGGPMVHLRAVPEGGRAGDPTGEFATNFERTFYSRYQAGGTADRRQPLPATFAARWISGGGTEFETSYKIWREGVTGVGRTCLMADNEGLAIPEITRFDEAENPVTSEPGDIISPTPPEGPGATLPESSRTQVTDDDVFPQSEDGVVGGWMYLNLNNGSPVGGDDDHATQNWVIVSMEAEGRYSVDFDAAWLGNGCTHEVAITEETFGGVGEPIGPASNDNPDDNLDTLTP